AFAAVEQTGLGKAESSESLAAGIKVALYTTIFGLFVAIPATLIAAHLQARARRLVAAIAEVIAPTIEALAALPATAKRPDQDVSYPAAESSSASDDEPEETHAA
ncbi:MAG: biopolymer transport protein ExbB/TolQ, partial [Hyphomicrobiaceae bacterium]